MATDLGISSIESMAREVRVMKFSGKRAALVVPGLAYGGGVPRAAQFMHWARQELGFSVSTFDLATSRQDSHSSRLVSPRTWWNYPQINQVIHSVSTFSCGAHLVDLELMRYQPRKILTDQLNDFDLVQMVSGIPAWANVLRDVTVPRILHVASTAQRERSFMDYRERSVNSFYRKTMTRAVHKLDQSGVRLVNHVFVMNDAMSQWCNDVRTSGEDVSLIPPGVDTTLFHPNKSWSKRSHLISVGRLGDPRKGWDRLFRCYANFLSSRSNMPDLVIVGSGKLGVNDSRLLADLGIQGRVQVQHDVSDLELLKLLQASSAFVQLSYEEGLGIAALEGLACGLPVIATNTDGSRQYVRNEVTGYLLSQDNATLSEQFARAATEILGETGSTMSMKARQYCVQKYSTKIVLDQISRAFELILNPRD